MKTNIVIGAFTVIILTVITILLFRIHNLTETEIKKRFNIQQLTEANQISDRLESFLSERTQGIEILSSFASLQHLDMIHLPSDVQNFFNHVKKTNIKSISIYNAKGTIIYSTDKAVIGHNYSRCDFFQWAAKAENKGKQFVSSLIQKYENKTEALSYFRFLIASSIYREKQNAAEKTSTNKFVGVVTETIDLQEVLSKFLPLVSRNAVKENVWIIDKNGTLLFQSEHPEMVLRNITHTEKSCMQCHISFDYIKEILSKKKGNYEYKLKKRPKKSASFASFEFKNISWTIVLNFPSEEITGFLSKHNRNTFFLFGLIALTLAAAFLKIYQSNRLKAKAEETNRKIEENFRKVIENIFRFVPEGLLVFTDKLNLFRENKAFKDIINKYAAKLNYTEQELTEIIIEQVKNRIMNADYTEIRIRRKNDRKTED